MHMKMAKALLCASLALVPGIATAKHASTSVSPITVTAGPNSLHQWSIRVSQAMDAHLFYPTQFGTAEPPEGGVRVAFHCSESGTPEGVSVVQSSRADALDQAAVYAVKHIPTLHPLPDGIDHKRPMEAWVFFAGDQRTADQMKRRFARQAQIAASRPHPAEQEASLAPVIFASR